jgi:hypothetical protein
MCIQSKGIQGLILLMKARLPALRLQAPKADVVVVGRTRLHSKGQRSSIMTDRATSAAIGIFGDIQHARYAIDDLRRNGFSDDQIGLITRNAEDNGAWSVPTRMRIVKLLGLIEVGGLLRHVVTDVDGVFNGLVGKLTTLGVTPWEAEQCGAEFVAGMTLIVVDAGEARRDALNLLRRYSGNFVHALQTDEA